MRRKEEKKILLGLKMRGLPGPKKQRGKPEKRLLKILGFNSSTKPHHIKMKTHIVADEAKKKGKRKGGERFLLNLWGTPQGILGLSEKGPGLGQKKKKCGR